VAELEGLGDDAKQRARTTLAALQSPADRSDDRDDKLDDELRRDMYLAVDAHALARTLRDELAWRAALARRQADAAANADERAEWLAQALRYERALLLFEPTGPRGPVRAPSTCRRRPQPRRRTHAVVRRVDDPLPSRVVPMIDREAAAA
jgi:hypothetical protein